jgi:hypothetical protein
MTPEEVKKINDLYAENDRLNAENKKLEEASNGGLEAVNARLDELFALVEAVTCKK